MTPLQLLEEKLKEYKAALEKSKEQLKQGKIDVFLHEVHKTNLEPLIAKYEYAIRILKSNP